MTLVASWDSGWLGQPARGGWICGGGLDDRQRLLRRAYHAAARPLQGRGKQCPPESLYLICVVRVSGVAKVPRICGEDAG
jgi:hypothetical protein